MSDLGAGPVGARDNPGFHSNLDCPVAVGPWVMSGRRHKPSFCWFWMQMCKDTALKTQTFFLA